MTQALERLLSLAHEVAAACPPELGGEIAVMGSAGAGLADEYSDLELLLLVDDTPTPEEARAWLESVGATDVLVGPDDSGVWGWCLIDGVEVEPYWHAASEAERDVAAIARGEVIDHQLLAVGHVFTHLRPIGSTASWPVSSGGSRGTPTTSRCVSCTMQHAAGRFPHRVSEERCGAIGSHSSPTRSPPCWR